MEIKYIPNEELEKAFKRINSYIEEEYKEEMFEAVSKNLGVPKETLEDKSLNDILQIISDKWNKV